MPEALHLRIATHFGELELDVRKLLRQDFEATHSVCGILVVGWTWCIPETVTQLSLAAARCAQEQDVKVLRSR